MYEYYLNGGLKMNVKVDKQENSKVVLEFTMDKEKIGRYLFPEEVVHHKDFNKLNNDPNNLMIFATKGDHTRFHMSGCNENILSLNSNGSYVCIAEQKTCADCGVPITRYGMRCPNCAKIHQRKVQRPTSEELFNILFTCKGNFTKVSQMYGVTDNAVRRWCDFYGLPRTTKDYKML